MPSAFIIPLFCTYYTYMSLFNTFIECTARTHVMDAIDSKVFALTLESVVARKNYVEAQATAKEEGLAFAKLTARALSKNIPTLFWVPWEPAHILPTRQNILRCSAPNSLAFYKFSLWCRLDYIHSSMSLSSIKLRLVDTSNRMESSLLLPVYNAPRCKLVASLFRL